MFYGFSPLFLWFSHFFYGFSPGFPILFVIQQDSWFHRILRIWSTSHWLESIWCCGFLGKELGRTTKIELSPYPYFHNVPHISGHIYPRIFSSHWLQNQSLATHGYGSIPIDTFLVGYSHPAKPAMTWGSLGTRGLTHPQLSLDIFFGLRLATAAKILDRVPQLVATFDSLGCHSCSRGLFVIECKSIEASKNILTAPTSSEFPQNLTVSSRMTLEFIGVHSRWSIRSNMAKPVIQSYLPSGYLT